MKAIIIAAGLGNRLMPLTNDKPKCLLEIKGKSIMQGQLEVLKQCGINDIVIVRGYKKEMINYSNIRYYENINYQNNNILRSLFYAESEMDDEFIFSYSDIIYGRDVVEKLLQKKADISLIIDTNWLSHYEGRLLHPVEEAELVMVESNSITKIGKNIAKPEEAYGEFIGLAKFSNAGAEILKTNYERVVTQFGNTQFHAAPSVEKAYLTDMLQELIDKGCAVSSVDIKGGWIEIDTSEDLERARKLFA